MKPPTGYFFNPSSLAYRLSESHPESPQRLEAIHERLSAGDTAAWLEPHTASFDRMRHGDALAAVHTAEHIDEVLSLGTTGIAAADAVAMAIEAVDAVFSGALRNAFCAVRPPGHHAHNDVHCDGNNLGEGFCFFNNVAIGARHAQNRWGTRNVLIVDWDYHHGNGTESFFYADPTVFYFSTHRLSAYPRTGGQARTGSGAGSGYTFNYPLPNPENPYGTVDDGHLMTALERLLARLGSLRFTPGIILISAGFDGLAGDPLGDFSLSAGGFARATDFLVEFAEHTCNGRIVSVLEGGYSPSATADAVEMHCAALAGTPPPIRSLNSGKDAS